MPDLFISYSRRDKAFVEALHVALEQRGHDAWVDWADIPHAADWDEQISEAIRDAQAFVFIVSPDSVASEVCRREALRAGEMHKRVIGIQLRDIGDATAPDPVARVNWIPGRGTRHRRRGGRSRAGAPGRPRLGPRTHALSPGSAVRWNGGGRSAACSCAARSCGRPSNG